MTTKLPGVSVTLEQQRLLDYTEAYLANSEEDSSPPGGAAGAPPGSSTNPNAGANKAMTTRKTAFGKSAMSPGGVAAVSQAASKQAAQRANV